MKPVYFNNLSQQVADLWQGFSVMTQWGRYAGCFAFYSKKYVMFVIPFAEKLT